MISKTAIALIVLLVIALLTASGTAFYYRGNAIDFKSQRDKASGELKLANATINDMQVRQRDVAALDAKYTKELDDATLKMTGFALSWLLVAGCGSQANVNRNPPPPAAWAMQEPSNSLQLLDQTFSVSEPESSATSQK